MERYAVGTWNILLGVLAGLIPLLSGAALLVRAGMTAESRPADRAAARRWPGWIAAGCLVAGAGLGAWALCSFLVFDQFRLGLVVCFF